MAGKGEILPLHSLFMCWEEYMGHGSTDFMLFIVVNTLEQMHKIALKSS